MHYFQSVQEHRKLLLDLLQFSVPIESHSQNIKLNKHCISHVDSENNVHKVLTIYFNMKVEFKVRLLRNIDSISLLPKHTTNHFSPDLTTQ